MGKIELGEALRFDVSMLWFGSMLLAGMGLWTVIDRWWGVFVFALAPVLAFGGVFAINKGESFFPPCLSSQNCVLWLVRAKSYINVVCGAYAAYGLLFLIVMLRDYHAIDKYAANFAPTPEFLVYESVQYSGYALAGIIVVSVAMAGITYKPRFHKHLVALEDKLAKAYVDKKDTTSDPRKIVRAILANSFTMAKHRTMKLTVVLLPFAIVMTLTGQSSTFYLFLRPADTLGNLGDALDFVVYAGSFALSITLHLFAVRFIQSLFHWYSRALWIVRQLMGLTDERQAELYGLPLLSIVRPEGLLFWFNLRRFFIRSHLPAMYAVGSLGCACIVGGSMYALGKVAVLAVRTGLSLDSYLQANSSLYFVFWGMLDSVAALLVLYHALKIYQEQRDHAALLTPAKVTSMLEATDARATEAAALSFDAVMKAIIDESEGPNIFGIPIHQTTFRIFATYVATALTLVGGLVSRDSSDNIGLD